MNDSCCPKDSLPSLTPPSDYKQQGTVSNLDDLPIYIVGNPDSRKAVIVSYDIYGFEGGRIRNICDEIAMAGFFVILPDFLRGNCWTQERELNDAANKTPFIKSVSDPQDIMRDVNDLILPYLRQQCNILKIGFAGYCYGGYVAYLVSQQENILSCAAGCHSSIRIFNLHGSNETEATIKVTCPQMLLQAGNDNPSGKVGSEVHQILSSKPFGDKCVLQEFPEMLHGWVPRGDLSDPKVVRDVTEAMRLVIEFLNTHMQ